MSYCLVAHRSKQASQACSKLGHRLDFPLSICGFVSEIGKKGCAEAQLPRSSIASRYGSVTRDVAPSAAFSQLSASTTRPSFSQDTKIPQSLPATMEKRDI